jgi:hypothetical protein
VLAAKRKKKESKELHKKVTFCILQNSPFMELSSSSHSYFLRSKREAPSVHVEEEAEEMQAEHADKEVKVEEHAMVCQRTLLLPDDVVQHIGLSVSSELIDKMLLCLRLSQVSHGFRAAMDGNNHALWQLLLEKEHKPEMLTWKQEVLLPIRLQHCFAHCMQAFDTAKGNVEAIKAASEKLLAIAKEGHPRAAAMCGYHFMILFGVVDGHHSRKTSHLERNFFSSHEMQAMLLGCSGVRGMALVKQGIGTRPFRLW